MEVDLRTLHLRALEPADIDFLYHLENDQSLWRVSNTLLPFSKHTLDNYISNAHLDIFSVKQQRFVLSDHQNTPLGLVDLYDFDPIHHRAGVGIVIDAKYRGQGMAKSGLKLIEKIAFVNLQMHQLYVGVGEENEISLQLFLASGYRQVGVKEDWIYYNNQYHNEVVLQKIAHV
jgi:diamine N-acetyltransferase